jgi:hypothetical protein
MVMTVGAPALPGVTVGGLKVATAPGGRPEADIVTTLSKAPPRGGTEILKVAIPPGATVTGAAGAVTVYAVVTTSATADELEAANSALPGYTAVMLSSPATRLSVVNVATPEESRVPVPSNVVPL